MTAEIIAFPDPLVVLKARWDALDAECQYDADHGIGDPDAISLRCVERSRIVLPHWCRDQRPAPPCRFGSCNTWETSNVATARTRSPPI
jgi:hypothetical protein